MGFRGPKYLVMVVMLASGLPLPGQTYSVIDLGTLQGGPSSVAYALNDSGSVVGFSRLPPTGFVKHAFLWVNGTLTDLGTLGGSNSFAYGINNQTQVVGESAVGGGGGDFAFLWEDGVMTELTTPNGSAGSAWGINDAGQITGGIGSSAYIWEDGELIELGTLPGFTASNGFGINSAGEVVGTAFADLFGPSRGFHWVDGVMTELGTLPGQELSGASAINDMGLIVGASATIIPSVPRAVFWSDGEAIDLGVGEGTRSVAYEVNNAGVIVGYWGINGQFLAHFATKWVKGELIDLNDVIPADSGWVLHEAYDINEVGQIVGGGINPDGQGRGFLLTPCAPADFECDGSVGPIDLAQLLGTWGPCGDCDDCPPDLNADCAVGPFDLASLLASWGSL